MKLVAAEGTLLEAVLDASYPQWNEGLTPRAYARWWDAQLQTAWGREHLHRYALVDGARVVASAKRYDLDAVLEGRRVRVMGIGAVFTQPDARGRGHARELMERIMDGGAGFEYALLFSEIGPEYYLKLGFDVVDLREVTVEVIEKPGAPATLVRAGEPRDLPAIAAIGEEMTRRFAFRLERSADLIQYALVKRRLLAGLGPHGERELQFFVSEEGTSAVAYVVLSVRGGEWTIEECGDRDPAGARVGAILQVLLARDPGVARPTIRGWLPHGFRPPQLRTSSDRPVAEVMMMRSLGAEVPGRPAARPLPTLTSADVLYWHADLF